MRNRRQYSPSPLMMLNMQRASKVYEGKEITIMSSNVPLSTMESRHYVTLRKKDTTTKS